MKLGAPGTKLRKVQDLIELGDWEAAIKIAANFPRLGEEERTIRGAVNAYDRPEFVREIGRDPETLIEGAKKALLRRFSPE